MTSLRALADPDHHHLREEDLRAARRGLSALERPPRILLLYGSLRTRSDSRLAVEGAARLLQRFGCETRIFDPCDLP